MSSQETREQICNLMHSLSDELLEVAAPQIRDVVWYEARMMEVRRVTPTPFVDTILKILEKGSG